jgi:hypothetical protein
MLELGQCEGATGGRAMISDIDNYDQLGGMMDRGSNLYSTLGGYNYTIVGFIVL